MDPLINKKLTIVAFGAHPDPFDMPYQAGGTLAKYARRGHRVIMVSASYEEEWQDEIAAIAKHLGAEHRFLDFVEGADDRKRLPDAHPLETSQERLHESSIDVRCQSRRCGGGHVPTLDIGPRNETTVPNVRRWPGSTR